MRKLAADRRYRRAAGELLCEGPKLLEEALRWGAPLRTVVCADPARLPQGPLFLCAQPDPAPPERLDGRRYLVLDGLQDPGNVGTLWRTADAFGADGLWLLPGCADPWGPKTLRATMGACFRLPVWEGALPALRALLDAAGLPLYATALREDTVDVRAVDLGRSAVVIGSEGRGVSQAVLDASARTLKIPMTPRCESLNAASAGTVVLWQMMDRPDGEE